MKKHMAVRITGTGSYLPERILGNEELARRVETSDEWIRSRTGILQRHIAGEDQATSDLAVRAGQAALEAAGRKASDMDMIVVATTTPDLVFPAVATMVQHKLGIHATRIPAFDVQAVCTGFIYAVSIAEKFIRTGDCQRVLVIGAETFSRILDWNDRTTCVLFGDGAGAVVLEAADAPGILSSHLHADGSFGELLKSTGGVSQTDPARRVIGHVHMEGQEVFKRAVTTLGEAVDEVLAVHGLDRAAIDWLVPHQANIRIIQNTAKRLGMKMERVVVTVDRHANTSAASVPLALDTAVRDGRILPGHLVLMEAFGGGFTWGSLLVRWG